MDILTASQRHKAMQANCGKDTKIELLLRKAIWHKGVRYRKNYRIYNCRPDIVITKYKIAVFCDGDFWHGREYVEHRIETNAKYWNEKIKRNIERDLENTVSLRDNGWTVLRFWEIDIRKNLDNCVAEILNAIAIEQWKRGNHDGAHEL